MFRKNKLYGEMLSYNSSLCKTGAGDFLGTVLLPILK